MLRYHIKVFTKSEHLLQLQKLNNDFNSMNWGYTEHCLDNLKYRAIDIKAVLSFIKDLELKAEQIFEYYIDRGSIIKVCYRIPYNKNQDIILVLGRNKQIITIYVNSSDDLHYTLKRELYYKG